MRRKIGPVFPRVEGSSRPEQKKNPEGGKLEAEARSFAAIRMTALPDGACAGGGIIGFVLRIPLF